MEGDVTEQRIALRSLFKRLLRWDMETHCEQLGLVDSICGFDFEIFVRCSDEKLVELAQRQQVVRGDKLVSLYLCGSGIVNMIASVKHFLEVHYKDNCFVPLDASQISLIEKKEFNLFRVNNLEKCYVKSSALRNTQPSVWNVPSRNECTNDVVGSNRDVPSSDKFTTSKNEVVGSNRISLPDRRGFISRHVDEENNAKTNHRGVDAILQREATLRVLEKCCGLDIHTHATYYVVIEGICKTSCNILLEL